MGPTPQGILKINVDGVSKFNNGLAGDGCVVKDCHRHWILGDTGTFGICSPMLTEPWVVFMGLHPAWKRGYTNIILEMDPLLVVSLLSDNDSFNSTNYVLIEKCKELLIRD